MRLTVDQRLTALEREVVVLHDTLKLLHKLIKDQGHLINDFIVHKVTAANDSAGGGEGGNGRPEAEVYTFICQRRFEKIERDMKRALKLIQQSHRGLKAG
jgi:hypothetical protein